MFSNINKLYNSPFKDIQWMDCYTFDQWLYNQRQNKQNCEMEHIDKNGSYVQRRKMYIGLPLHNMKSKVLFDWQNNDISVQDQMGYRFKHKQESQQIRKKYEQKLEKRIYSKYVEHRDDHQYSLNNTNTQQTQDDILSQELQHFNHSKIIMPSQDKIPQSPSQNMHKEAQERFDRAQKLDGSYSRLNQSQKIRETSPPNPPQRNIRQSSYDGGYYQGQNNQEEEPYNPKNYATLNPATDRYKPYEPYPISYNYDYSSPIKGEKSFSGALPNSYPLRNVIPDKLQTRLRERVKADNKAVKVTLNLFDYKKP